MILLMLLLTLQEIAAHLLKMKGNKVYADGNYADATSAYSEAIALTPQAAFFTNRAACYVEERKWRKVVEDCDRALTLDPRWVRAFERKASVLIELQKYDEALSVAGLSLATNKEA